MKYLSWLKYWFLHELLRLPDYCEICGKKIVNIAYWPTCSDQCLDKYIDKIHEEIEEKYQ